MKINLSKLSQLFFLVIFIILFIKTEYRGKDEISLAINSFFRANPLVVVSYLFANGSFLLIFLPGLFLIIATFFLGRFFCGWICPLGTIIDEAGKKIKHINKNNIINPKFKYFLLTILLVMALFQINVAGLFDPIGVLVRFLTFSIYPVVGYISGESWATLYKVLGEKRDYLEPFYSFLKNNILPFRNSFYPLAFLSFIMFAFIIFLEKYEKRNWCKNLCPLGTLLGILSVFSIFKRLPNRVCNDCKDCRDICPTAFDQEVLNKSNCILCMECNLRCTNKRVLFKVDHRIIKNNSISYDRRTLFSGFFTGFLLSKLFGYNAESSKIRVLRPPGVKDEGVFLKKCVRCGECMKICLRNALYPAVLQSGLYGISTPVLIPRQGYCEYNCTLCGQVCPTKAIPELSTEEKNKAVIGVAVFDKNHCLPYAKKINCIVCEEHCPVPDKAIKLEIVDEVDYKGNRIKLKKPYVVDKLCIGCGICEYICPIDKAGVEVFAKREDRFR